MTTVTELGVALGKTIGVRCEQFTIPMRILDVKLAYGQGRFLVSPLHGQGQQWVLIDRFVKLPETGSFPALDK